MKTIIVMILTSLFAWYFPFAIAQETGDALKNSEPQKTKAILFADKDNDGELDDNEALVVMTAEDYQKVFKTKAPLERMLRSQVNEIEYIVLKNKDFKMLDSNKDSSITAADQHGLHKIFFIKISGIIKGDFIATDAEMVPLGKLKGIVLNTNTAQERIKQKEHEAHFKGGDELNIKTSKEPMPWMGL